MLTVIMHKGVWSNCSHNTDFMPARGTMLPERFVSHFADITWSTCSPDLAVSEYCLLGYSKSKAYTTCLAKTDNLIQWIQDCNQGIHKEILQYVLTSFPLQLQECTKWHGNHLHVSHSNSMTKWILMDMEGTLPMLIKFVHFALKCYLIWETLRCSWLSLYN